MAAPGPAHRDLRLDVSTLARRFLSEETAASDGAPIRQRRIQFHRDQWILLFAPASVQLSTLVCRDAAGICLQREGTAVHYPHEKTAQGGGPARELFRFRSFVPARKTRSDSLAVSAQFRLEPGAFHRILRSPSARYPRGGEAGEATRRQIESWCVDEN